MKYVDKSTIQYNKQEKTDINSKSIIAAGPISKKIVAAGPKITNKNWAYKYKKQ